MQKQDFCTYDEILFLRFITAILLPTKDWTLTKLRVIQVGLLPLHSCSCFMEKQ